MWYKLKRILIYPDGVTEKQVYPKYEWKPDASRTLLYLPLESNATDYSWNSISTTPSNVTYASLGWVMCANANGSSSKIQLSNISFLPSDATGWTISFLIYWTSRTVWSTYRKALEFASSNAYIWAYYNTWNNGIWCNWFNNDGYITDSDATLNSWHLITFTFDSTNCYAYFDGVFKFWWSRYSSNPIWWKTPDVTWFYIFCNRGWNTNRWSWWGRELIIEKVKRSAEDVSKYYQRIKAKLWF